MIDHTLGVVLTGGASRRMGTDKASIAFDGATLLERSVSVMSSVFTSVVVSGEAPVGVGIPVVADRVAGLGPLGGLDAAYEIAEGRAVFLLAVDMPFMDTETILAIADAIVPEMGARVPVAAGRRQRLCAAYGASLGPFVRECLDGEDRSMDCVLRRIDVHEVVGLDDDLFTNVNTVDDLEAAINRTGRHRSTR